MHSQCALFNRMRIRPRFRQIISKKKFFENWNSQRFYVVEHNLTESLAVHCLVILHQFFSPYHSGSLYSITVISLSPSCQQNVWDFRCTIHPKLFLSVYSVLFNCVRVYIVHFVKWKYFLNWKKKERDWFVFLKNHQLIHVNSVENMKFEIHTKSGCATTLKMMMISNLRR